MSGKEFIGGVAVSAAILVLFAFFALPLIFPAVKQENIVRQSIYEEFDTNAFIFDSSLTYSEMPDTTLDISIQKNSKISITFSAVGILHLDDTFNIKAQFLIALQVEGVGNRTFVVSYFDNGGAVGHMREFLHTLHYVYVTEPLPAGTYSIQVYWKSGTDAAGSNQLNLHGGLFDYTRALWVLEIA